MEILHRKRIESQRNARRVSLNTPEILFDAFSNRKLTGGCNVNEVT